MTPGVTEETADGMSLEKGQSIIEAIQEERYQWSPARRIYLEKKNATKKRPLGLPVCSEKVLQEVIRSSDVSTLFRTKNPLGFESLFIRQWGAVTLR
jgi:retron-type reverse transcriptase